MDVETLDCIEDIKYCIVKQQIVICGGHYKTEAKRWPERTDTKQEKWRRILQNVIR